MSETSSISSARSDSWPDIPLAAWAETCDTLHLWTQIVGKVRLALTPLVNHWWNVTLYVTSRGLVTSPMPCGARTIDIAFDFVEHRLTISCSDGRSESLALAPMSVAEFYSEVMARLHRLGVDVHIWTMPGEIENAVPFDRDRTHAQYDRAAVERFHGALVQADRVLKTFRARFIGKASPVHFFWGSFDLAVTRFSGRTAPPPKGPTPNVASWVMAEAYSHEVSSCGFWPGNGGYGRAAFYVYAYPEPAGYGETRLRTPDAFYDGGSRPVHPALRRGAPGARSRRAAARLSAGDIRRSGHARQMGPHRAGTLEILTRASLFPSASAPDKLPLLCPY